MMAFQADMRREINAKAIRAGVGDFLTVHTTHSYFYDLYGRQFGSDRIGKGSPGFIIARDAGFSKNFIYGGEYKFTNGFIGNCLKEWVSSYCFSNDPVLRLKHFPIHAVKKAVPKTPNESSYDYETKLLRACHDLSRQLLPHAERLWARQIDLEDTIPVNHDVYMKLGVMDNVPCIYEKIICDEFQDSNPALVGWLCKQQAYGKQIIGVGDPLQSIYGFRKARDALSDAVFPGFADCMSISTLTLSQSFRFGDEIADLTNAIAHASGSTFVLRGTPELSGSVGPGLLPSAYICATNAQCLDIAITSMNTPSPVYFRGDKRSMVSLLGGIDNLNSGSISAHALLVNFRSLSEMIEHAEMADPELKRIYEIYTKLGLSEATSLVESLTRDKRDHLPPGSRIAITAHTAKGQEYESTCLIGFKEPRNNAENGAASSDQAWNVIYVAASRAMKNADVVSDLESSWIDELYEKHLNKIGKERPVHTAYTPEITAPAVAKGRAADTHAATDTHDVDTHTAGTLAVGTLAVGTQTSFMDVVDTNLTPSSRPDLQEPDGFMDGLYDGHDTVDTSGAVKNSGASSAEVTDMPAASTADGSPAASVPTAGMTGDLFVAIDENEDIPGPS
jgi:5'(3')-deoxyribonucleotidase